MFAQKRRFGIISGFGALSALNSTIHYVVAKRTLVLSDNIVLFRVSNLPVSRRLLRQKPRLPDLLSKSRAVPGRAPRGDIFQFPIPYPEKAMHDKMVSLVERMLALHKQSPRTPQESEMMRRKIEATDKSIDRLVYELSRKGDNNMG